MDASEFYKDWANRQWRLQANVGGSSRGRFAELRERFESVPLWGLLKRTMSVKSKLFVKGLTEAKSLFDYPVALGKKISRLTLFSISARASRYLMRIYFRKTMSVRR